MFNLKIINLSEYLAKLRVVTTLAFLSSCYEDISSSDVTYRRSPPEPMPYQQNAVPVPVYYYPYPYPYSPNPYVYGYQNFPASRYYSNPYAMPPPQNIYNDQDQYYKPPTSYGSQDYGYGRQQSYVKPSAYDTGKKVVGDR